MTSTPLLMWAPSPFTRKHRWRPVRAEIRTDTSGWPGTSVSLRIWARFPFWPLASVRLEHITMTCYIEGTCEICIEHLNYDHGGDDGVIRLQAATWTDAHRFIGELREAICDRPLAFLRI